MVLQKRIVRTSFSHEKKYFLEKIFLSCPVPTMERMKEIADKLGEPYHRIIIWFRNKRSKCKANYKAYSTSILTEVFNNDRKPIQYGRSQNSMTIFQASWNDRNGNSPVSEVRYNKSENGQNLQNNSIGVLKIDPILGDRTNSFPNEFAITEPWEFYRQNRVDTSKYEVNCENELLPNQCALNSETKTEQRCQTFQIQNTDFYRNAYYPIESCDNFFAYPCKAEIGANTMEQLPMSSTLSVSYKSVPQDVIELNNSAEKEDYFVSMRYAINVSLNL